MTQLHRYGSLGCIDVAAVLQPLDFVLPQRETLAPAAAPELDLSSDLSSLTFETPLTEPEPDPEPSVEAGRPDAASSHLTLSDSDLKSEEQDEETIQDQDFSLE